MTSSRRKSAACNLRKGRIGDLDALLALENAVFQTDRLSRRSLHRFIGSPTAALIVAEMGGRLAGYALVLFSRASSAARLYSIAVAPHSGRRGLGPLLLIAAEEAALRRGRSAIRLEVHEHNTRAIGRYETSGYRLFGRHHHYYADRGDALRFEKALGRNPQKTRRP